MRKINVAINGFGRIGRVALRLMMDQPNIQVVAINDLTDAATLKHLFKYDSVHGVYKGSIAVKDSYLQIEDQKIQILSERDPENLPWKELDIDLVIESTGIFITREGAKKHIKAGAKKVLISAPAKGDGIKTIVLGVNDDTLNGDDIVSNASCTTNCIAPMIKVLQDKIGIEQGYITTVHAYTSDQNIQDAPHSDLRRARSGAVSIIPTTTGAAAAVGLVLPELNGKLDGMAMRVPVPDGSITDCSLILKEEVTADQINTWMKEASETSLKGIMEYTDEPIVSADIVGNKHSCIFDSQLTKTHGKMVKLIGWYDNEVGYASRLVDMVGRLCEN
ncbi:MAG: type I glyceraldehyde-3-phosphate dehydrogenase [Flavobacteriales bacterium]|nr:type I glyceraldehyde-3-phosphate dehydrogenase [Flavobacteriales bacterium]